MGQSKNGLEGKNTADDDFDTDGWSNLVEFALWMKADSPDLIGQDGTTLNRGIHESLNDETGKVDLEFMRPQDLQGISYRILVNNKLDDEWEEVEGDPSITDLGNRAVSVCYRDLKEFVEFSEDRFFVRIEVTELQ
ncbi:MAG: hypothetical protein ACI8T1_002676 [Verrucomicrobiales bacterium]|jgi:hypothetical protein